MFCLRNMTEVTQIPKQKRLIHECCKCVTACRNGSQGMWSWPKTNYSQLFRSDQILCLRENTQGSSFSEETLKLKLRAFNFEFSWCSHSCSPTSPPHFQMPRRRPRPRQHLPQAPYNKTVQAQENTESKGLSATCSENGKRLSSATGQRGS